MTWDRPKASATARGYGRDHQAVRAATISAAYGQPCSRCGKPMLRGQKLHLDHDDEDRTRYRGFSHSWCNVKAGARKGARIANRRRRWRRSQASPSEPSLILDDW